MINSYFFKRIVLFFLSLFLLLDSASIVSAISLPAYQKISLAQQFHLYCKDITAPTLQKGSNSSDFDLKKSILQRNKTLDYLLEFAALRTAVLIIAPYDAKIFDPLPELQDNNTFHKDYIHSLLPQKKPEDSYQTIV
ncbi:MAG TPA: hypothetical protein PLU71_03565 [Candidatus Dependentiae bacterium]|nr:hypothetical protein [Candidatus Dependentiae bacterium]HRQ62911.1 hypothetical protein [Candidatus Dependentiae bacterium]